MISSFVYVRFSFSRNILPMSALVNGLLKQKGKDMNLVIDEALKMISKWNGLIQTQLVGEILKLIPTVMMGSFSKDLNTLLTGNLTIEYFQHLYRITESNNLEELYSNTLHSKCILLCLIKYLVFNQSLTG